MTRIPRWRRYLRLTRPNVAADVSDELDFHLEMRVADYVRRGMSPADARAKALSRFGEVSAVRETLVDHDRHKEVRERRREFMGDFLQDVRFGWRSLRRTPGFAIAAVLTLAVGIGANTAIFSVVDALLLRPLPYLRPQELVSIGSGSAGEFLGLRERLKTFAEVAGFSPKRYSIDDGRDAVRLTGAAVTTNLFRTLGVSPVVGTAFGDEASIPGNDTRIILSYGFWQRQYAGQLDAIGRRLLVDGVPFTVVGVMAEDFHYPSNATQYWLPLAFNPSNLGSHWGVFDCRFIGRVKPGVTVQQAEREVREVWPTMRRLNPLWDPGPMYGKGRDPKGLQATMVGAPQTLLWVLLGSVMLVLLIACVNVANLLLARATARQRELAVRAAVGGGRERLIRQLITESVMLSSIGAVLGVLLALVAVKWLVSILPPGIPRAQEIAVNGSVLIVTAVIAVMTGLLFGIIPAIRATSSTDGVIGSGRRMTSGARHHRVSGLLVGGEVALAVLLVIGAQLLVRSFRELRAVQPGFQTAHLLAARVSPPSAAYRDAGRVDALYDAILARVRALPGVTQVAAADKLPMASSVWGFAARIQGQFEDATKSLPSIDHMQSVSPAYFEAMAIPVLRGRALDATDVESSTPVALVSESFAKHFWPDADAVGNRIGYPWESPWITIVGIVPDVRQDSLRDTTRMSVYVPWGQRSRMSGSVMWVLTRTSGDPRPLATALRGIVHDVDRSVPVSDIRTMDEILDVSVQRDRFTMILVGLFAGAALLLGAVGIYGVMSYLVSQRTQEMGVRLALGASRGSVLALVVRRGVWMAGLGALAGVVVAMWATKPLGALLYGVSATDPVTFLSVPLLFMLVAVVASYVPARRATRVDPARALRSD
jgi:putative ABC transport system permease protein